MCLHPVSMHYESRSLLVSQSTGSDYIYETDYHSREHESKILPQLGGDTHDEHQLLL
jgi:hypothetical protein